MVSSFLAEFRSSPIPDPDTLGRYEAVCPGAAKEILDRWKEQQQHRHRIEAELVRAEVEKSQRNASALTIGRICALLVIVVMVGASILMLQIDSVVAKIIAALLDASLILGLADMFIFSRRRTASAFSTPAGKAAPKNRRSK